MPGPIVLDIHHSLQCHTIAPSTRLQNTLVPLSLGTRPHPWVSTMAPSPTDPLLLPIPSHTHLLLLLSQATPGAVKLQEERGCRWQLHPTEAATGIGHHLIQELWVGQRQR